LKGEYVHKEIASELTYPSGTRSKVLNYTFLRDKFTNEEYEELQRKLREEREEHHKEKQRIRQQRYRQKMKEQQALREANQQGK
jgi:hypothetical protein